jgi:hypothetical protein
MRFFLRSPVIFRIFKLMKTIDEEKRSVQQEEQSLLLHLTQQTIKGSIAWVRGYSASRAVIRYSSCGSWPVYLHLTSDYESRGAAITIYSRVGADNALMVEPHSQALADLMAVIESQPCPRISMAVHCVLHGSAEAF